MRLGRETALSPVNHEDLVQRLQTVHNRLAATQSDPRSNILESAIHHLPIALRYHAIQLLNRLQ